ncbi:hypothetical protein EYF80_036803 [Liparis tanakae]|uniref:Uncharacterized protein n=1 Tax=Liparis tanakae TaxID=230148 RepID=A0A4Z2GJM6_9TELE|nr:hypothetical protein EYF80_036803 [Liparis tanakae]
MEALGASSSSSRVLSKSSLVNSRRGNMVAREKFPRLCEGNWLEKEEPSGRRNCILAMVLWLRLQLGLELCYQVVCSPQDRLPLFFSRHTASNDLQGNPILPNKEARGKPVNQATWENRLPLSDPAHGAAAEAITVRRFVFLTNY